MAYRLKIITQLTALMLIIFSASVVSRESPAIDGPQRITIDVFSKQFRLLKEKKIPPLVFVFKESTIVENRKDGLLLTCKKIECTYDDTFSIRCDESILSPPYDLSVRSENVKGSFSILIQGETKPREYPLPMTIRGDFQKMVCIVSDDILSYARDSAAAEYGISGNMASEACEALALIIYSRSQSQRAKPLHDGAVFCDLTHCQSYRGKLLKNVSSAPAWVIDANSAKRGLYFHACCGGTTFGPEVFSQNGAASAAGVTDRISEEGVWLCRDASSAWERDIPLNELAAILSGKDIGSLQVPVTCAYDKKKMILVVMTGQTRTAYAAEDFRLRINRVKGWSFIRSNNYVLSEQPQGTLHFSGQGLGHGVGFCQNGAMALAKRGYSRYEILQHYYKNINFERTRHGTDLSPYLMYYRFNMKDGSLYESSYAALAHRRQPTGSAFKVLVALYLVSQRPDLASMHTYTCTGSSRDAVMPAHCGNTKGHGEMTLSSALPQSCNYYFSSLYQKIDRNDFMRFMHSLCEKFSLSLQLPEIKNDRAWAAFLAGLDNHTTATVEDYAKIVRILYSGTGVNEYTNMHDGFISLQQRQTVYSYLFATFQNGTASEKLIMHWPNENFENLFDASYQRQKNSENRMWGKTSSVVTGTNNLTGYGLFLGGSGDTGIVAIIRHGNGNLAARQARYILDKNDH
jgi:SpoIID/LytB domain protein